MDTLFHIVARMTILNPPLTVVIRQPSSHKKIVFYQYETNLSSKSLPHVIVLAPRGGRTQLNISQETAAQVLMSRKLSIFYTCLCMYKISKCMISRQDLRICSSSATYFNIPFSFYSISWPCVHFFFFLMIPNGYLHTQWIPCRYSLGDIVGKKI